MKGIGAQGKELEFVYDEPRQQSITRSDFTYF